MASPIVVQATMPRFLSFGDQGVIMLELNNLTDIVQNITLETNLFGPVAFTGRTGHAIALAPHKRKSLKLPITAGTTTGRGHITCRIKGIQGPGVSPEMTKTWFLETPVALPPPNPDLAETVDTWTTLFHVVCRPEHPGAGYGNRAGRPGFGASGEPGPAYQ